MNLVCSICSEKYISSDDVTIVSCGHMFHRVCLLPWIERSATCPECRASCNVAGLSKVYLNTETSDRTTEHRAGLQKQLDALQVKTRVQENSLKDLEKTILDSHREQEEMRSDMAELQESLEMKDATILSLNCIIEMQKGDLKTLQKKYERCLKRLVKMDKVTSALAALNQDDDDSDSSA